MTSKSGSGVADDGSYEYEEESVQNARGMKLFTCRWLPPKGQTVKAHVFLCHGYAVECSVTMRGTGVRLAQAGYAVYGVDYEGHGKSEGLQGYIPSFDLLVSDTEAFFAAVVASTANTELPRFLLGESMGGAVALLLHRMRPSYWTGAVLVAPMCKEFQKMLSPVPNGEQPVGGAESEHGSVGGSYAENSEEESRDSEGSGDVESSLSPELCFEHGSKRAQDPSADSEKEAAPSAKAPKRTRTSSHAPTEKAAKQPKVTSPKPRKALPRIKVTVPVASTAATSTTSPMQTDGDRVEAESADAATSRKEVIHVRDDDEEPPRRDAGKGTATPTAPQATTQRMPPSGAPQVPPAPAMTVPPGQGSSQAGAGSVAAPSIALATAPTPPVNIFNLYKVPEDQTGASKEAMIQAELMTQQLREMCAAGKLAYDASAALQENVRKNCELGTQYVALEKETAQLRVDLEVEKRNTARAQAELRTMGETMKQALESKDNELAGAQKVAKEKTKVAEEKLVSLGKLEAENISLKKEVLELKKQQTEWDGKLKAQAEVYDQEKKTLTEKVAQLIEKRNALERYIEEFTEEMYNKLAEYCRNFELETDRIERDLNPSQSLVGDKAALGILRVESRIEDVQGYIIRLRGALGRIDKELWPKDTLDTDLEAMMTRLNDIPSRVQAWKKSAARCGADVALSLVRVHCKEAKEEKLKALQVANTKKLQFEDFMETFIEAATRIADGIDLDTFVEPASPTGA